MLRILTENKQKNEIENILIALGLDFTVYEAEGTWKGIREKSLVIELADAKFSEAIVAAKEIRKLNNQESVYVQDILDSLYKQTERGTQCLKSHMIF